MSENPVVWTRITDQAARNDRGTHVEAVGMSDLVVHCGDKHATVIPIELLEQILKNRKPIEAFEIPAAEVERILKS